MSPLPTRMINRWQNRKEPGPGQGTLYWHMLVGDQPEARKAARIARERLAAFSGLHMPPLEWLHITTLVVGPTDKITTEQQQDMLTTASALLAKVPPISVTVDRLFYHPEAIALAIRPTEHLEQVREAIQTATLEATGRQDHTEGTSRWVPHATLIYSEAEQPAEPIISALGREIPSCAVTIDAVTLVDQRGPERLWDWHPIGRAQLLGRH
ncbi:hypothetical protein Acsp03_71820 [Actinomadura sp. NBRC 104412]|uniref:2'-5' RNA ligase family protein n=1 Tax=Actinomadura sp. NBRC 104412 TaxID=3032203 RepID=UPI0024A13029|nr:2'-5' RNA ligase family protein [Actinomadura sp. NBRC 104412]GLZ09716.1 hypothetical protein Acsp03_71820 [Actinomadura sp. NBRC 104412]